MARLGSAVLGLTVLATGCRAESAGQQGPQSGAVISASAHLDFRVVVLPSMALSMQSAGWRVQGNSGVLTLQRSAADAADGGEPGASLHFSPRRRGTDTSVPVTTAAHGNLVTVASP